MRGPIEFVVIEFPGPIPARRLADEFARLQQQEIVRIVDILIVTKAEDGTVTGHELGEYAGDEEYEQLDAVIQAVDGLIGEADVADLAADLNPGTSAVVVLFEHTWALHIRRTIQEAGGAVVFIERIPGPVVDTVEQPGETKETVS